MIMNSNTPLGTQLKNILSIRLGVAAYRHVRTKPNMSRYIEGLITQDMQMNLKKPIYTAITNDILKDEEFLAFLKQRLNEVGGVVKQVDKDISIVEGDWGA